MIHIVVSCLILLGGYLDNADPEEATLAGVLEARLNFNVLWRTLPEAAIGKLPRDVSVTVYQDESELTFCSQPMGLCEKYFWNNGVLGDRRVRKPIPREATEREALETFRREIERDPAYSSARSGSQTAPSPRFQLQSGQSLGGIAANTSPRLQPAGTIKAVTIQLRTKDALLREYRSGHSTQLKSFLAWIQAELKDSEYRYRTAKVACLKDPDPYVFVLATSDVIGETIQSYKWNDEARRFEFAGFAEPRHNERSFREEKQMIESLTCGVVHWR